MTTEQSPQSVNLSDLSMPDDEAEEVFGVNTYSPFDGRGGFVPATEFQLDMMTNEQVAAYQGLHDAFVASNKVEAEFAATEKELHAVVREKREVEAKLAELPKRSFNSLVREVIAAGRR